MHPDQINSWKSVTTSAGGMMEDTLLYPWGQSWTYAGTGWGQIFADLPLCCGEIGQYFTPIRGYSLSQARWTSPDPLGGDITNPQSLNRYAYALNNPTTLTDAMGLQSGDDSDCTWDSATATLNCPAPPSTSSDFGPGDPMLQFIFDISACLNPLASCPFPSTLSQKAAAPGVKPPPLATVVKQVNQCAASYANQHSLASELGVSNVPVLGSVFSNDAATLSNIAFGPNRAGGAGSLLLSNPTDANAMAGGARLVGALPNPFASPTINVTVRAAAVSTDTFDLTAVSVDVSKTVPTIGESALGKVIGGSLNAVTAFKAPYDAVFYINGLAACSGLPHF